MAEQFDLLKFKKMSSLAEASPVLDALQASGSREELLQAITHPVTDVRNDAIKRIQQIGDKYAVPQLIKALKDANVPAMGSEHATAQIVYKENLLKAVNTLTGQDFSIADVNNSKELNETVSRMKKWADENL